MAHDHIAGGARSPRAEGPPGAGAPVAAGPRTPAPASLLASWRGMVEEVEEGYAWCGPEFANDCSCRDRLMETLPTLSEQAAAAVRAQLDVLDERFLAATIPWPGHEAGHGRWWLRRVPRVLEPDVGERYTAGWPLGWEMLPFPKPDSVRVVGPDDT